MSKILVLAMIFISFAGTIEGKNDLNTVLVNIISQMNNDGFFLRTWTEVHHTIPIPVPNDCSVGGDVERQDADSSLASVLDRGTLRIGLAKLAAGIPAYYSASPTATDPTDLDAGDLQGYEIICAKEATKRLGDLYNIAIAPDFITIVGSTYFEPLRDALNNNTIDVVWSAMFPTPERELEVDFTCSTFSTEQVIGAGNGVAPKSPSPFGDNVTVACVRGFCALQPPAPFSLRRMEPETNDAVFEALLNTTDGIDYAVYTFEQLGMFFDESCPNCSYVDMEPLATIVRIPATKLMTKDAADGTTTTNSNAAKSSSPELIAINFKSYVPVLSNLLTSMAFYFASTAIA